MKLWGCSLGRKWKSIAGYIIRLLSVITQIGSVALIVEKGHTGVSEIYFSQISISLLAALFGSVAFPIHAFPFVRRRRGAQVIALALQIQIVTFCFVGSIVGILCWVQGTNILSGIAFYVIALISQNHYFHRHHIVARGLPTSSILIYESASSFAFLAIVFIASLFDALSLSVVTIASLLGALAIWFVGVRVSHSYNVWVDAFRLVLRPKRVNISRMRRRCGDSIPMLTAQFIQTASTNFPVLSISFASSGFVVVVFGLLQRLLGVAQTLGWLQVTSFLPLYFVKRDPRKALIAVLRSQLILTGIIIVSGVVLRSHSVAKMLGIFLPNITNALIILAGEPIVYALPMFIIMNLHLEQVYIGAMQQKKLVLARAMGMISTIVAFFGLLLTGMFRTDVEIVHLVSGTYAVYFIVQLVITYLVNGRALNIRAETRSDPPDDDCGQVAG